MYAQLLTVSQMAKRQDLPLIQPSDAKTFRISNELQKYKQETQYVCLKLGVKDWMAFLTEVRTGAIVRSSPTTHEASGCVSIAKAVPRESGGTLVKKPVTAIQILAQVFENKSTKRSMYRKKVCDCQSPIWSEEKIKNIKGSDSSFSESSCTSGVCNEVVESEVDPFQKYKIQDLWVNNNRPITHNSLEEMIKSMEQKQVQGFDTFRKTVNEQRSHENGVGQVRERKAGNNQSTAKKNYKQGNFIEIQEAYEPSFQRVDSQEWIRQQIDQDHGCNMKEFLLALQNTKLRKQIKNLQTILSHNAGNEQKLTLY